MYYVNIFEDRRPVNGTRVFVPYIIEGDVPRTEAEAIEQMTEAETLPGIIYARTLLFYEDWSYRGKVDLEDRRDELERERRKEEAAEDDYVREMSSPHLTGRI